MVTTSKLWRGWKRWLWPIYLGSRGHSSVSTWCYGCKLGVMAPSSKSTTIGFGFGWCLTTSKTHRIVGTELQGFWCSTPFVQPKDNNTGPNNPLCKCLIQEFIHTSSTLLEKNTPSIFADYINFECLPLVICYIITVKYHSYWVNPIFLWPCSIENCI